MGGVVTVPDRPIDPVRLQQAAQRISGDFAAAMTAAMVHVGLNLGLYQAMDGAGPLTSVALAKMTGLHERWVREWLWQQTAAHVVELADESDHTFELSPEAATVLLDQRSPLFAAMYSFFPMHVQLALRTEECFRSGIGYSFDEGGTDRARQNDLNLGRWHREMLIPVALPKLDGVIERLEAGAQVADVGSGSGAAVLEIAKRFPASEAHGYEISAEMLAFSLQARERANLPNARFHDASVDPLPPDGRFDLVMTNDCLHDMANPSEMAGAIRASLKLDGSWFITEMDAKETLRDNLERLGPVAPMLLGGSLRMCLPSSMVSPDDEGHGILGLPERRLESIVRGAGFGHFRRLEIPHPFNAYYEARL